MRTDANGFAVYENLDELLAADIVSISEYDGFYYVKTKPDCYYDNSIWKVNKQTRKATFMLFTEYIVNVMDKAKEIDPAILRRGA